MKCEQRSKDLAPYDKHLTRSPRLATPPSPAHPAMCETVKLWQLRTCSAKYSKAWRVQLSEASLVAGVFILHSLIGIGNWSVFINANCNIAKISLRPRHFWSTWHFFLPPPLIFSQICAACLLFLAVLRHYWNSSTPQADWQSSDWRLLNWLITPSRQQSDR